MNSYSYFILLVCIISLSGTMIGAILGVIVKNPSEKFLSIIIGMACGVMISIVVLDLIPEALQNLSFTYFIFYFCVGVAMVVIINNFIIRKNASMGEYKRIAVLVILALGIHNFPEGLIMGCGIGLGSTLGLKMSIMIAMHDIPEGIAAAAPFMAAKEKVSKILLYSFLSSLPTLLGAFIGVYLGVVSGGILGILFAFVSGIMSYIVFGEMMPESYKLYNKISGTIGIFLGIFIGIIIIKIL